MDNEKQMDEVIALESIYNNEEFSYHKQKDRYYCNLKIFVNLPENYHFTYKDSRISEGATEKVFISHLPPLVLCVSLPENYPSLSPPKFTLCSSWLSHMALGKLCKKLDELWEENNGQEILFTWIGFLQDDTLTYLNKEESIGINYIYTMYKVANETLQNNSEDLEQSSDNIEVPSGSWKSQRKQMNKPFDKRGIIDFSIYNNPVEFLIDYNERRKQTEFKRNFYTCKICFSDKLGEHCIKFLPCCHIFCAKCISSYVGVKIAENSVMNIYCPEDKCKSEMTPSQIKELLTPELFEKYDSILLNTTLDTMSDIVYCPRKICQYPVTREGDESMATCPLCLYVFCIYCKAVYHGIEPCKINHGEKLHLVNEYRNSNSLQKISLEKRYGKKQLQTLVENSMSEEWINSHSRHCPHCRTAIEKSDGCNKMTCKRCNTQFCWICGMRLNSEAPYLHFQQPNSKCFNKLFYGAMPEDDDDENVNEVFFGDDEDFFDDNEFIYFL